MNPIEKPALPEPSGLVHRGYKRTHIVALEEVRHEEFVYSERKMHAYAGTCMAPLLARIEELEKDAARLTLSRLDKECLRIGQQIQRAAAELPDCYEIEIELERGSGSVYLSNPDYSKVAFNDHVDGFSESIGQAIDAALSATKEPS